MKLNRYLSAFPQEDLVKGAELYFSNALTGLRVTHDGKTARFEDNGALQQPAGQQPIEYTDVSAKVPVFDKQQETELVCSICWLPKEQLVYSRFCSCRRFAENGYSCEHTAALLTALLVEQEGEDCLRGTVVEEKLRQTAMVEDPFQPGVLQRTDDRLLSLLESGVITQLPTWHKAAKPKELMGLDLIFHSGRKDLIYFELKLGASRHYQMNDLPGLLTAYRRREPFPFGRNSFTVSPEGCEPYAERVLTYLGELMTAKENGLYKGELFFNVSGMPSGRFMTLKGRQLDELLQLCDGQQVFVQDTSLPVDLDRRGLKATLRKKAYGATLSVSAMQKLCATDNWLYLRDQEGVFRLEAQGAAEQARLLSMLAWSEPLYIRESDLPHVCRQLLPFFRDHGTLVTRGIDPENYGAQTPSFRFDLDYTDEGDLVCSPWALYPRAGQEFRLYDNQSGKAMRNARAEQQAAALCARCFDAMDPETCTLTSRLSEEGLYDFLRNGLPELEKLGTVRATDSVHRSAVRPLPRVKVGVSLSGGSLLMQLQGGGYAPEEMNELLSAYSRRKRYHRLKSGAFVSFEGQDTDTWDTLSQLYQHYGRKGEKDISLPLYRALYLQQALESRDDAELVSTEAYRDIVSGMGQAEQDDAAIPFSLRETLRAYQKEGFHWLRMLKKSGFGGILADDMGLGKTLQVLSFLLAEKERGCAGDALRTLIVCPASLVYNWQKELETFTPELSCCVISGTAAARDPLISNENTAEVWITSYDLLKRDISRYEGIRFANQVIDEAQFIKNQSTQAAQAVRVVNSGFRMALTGTPIENHLSELWSIMDYLMPGFLYAYTRFLKEYETPIVSQGDAEAMERLRRMVHPFILRRLKKDVLKELPDKLNEVVAVRLQGEQRKLYDAAASRLKQYLARASGAKDDKLVILKHLTLLRQICCDPALVYEDYRGGSEKLEACMTLVRQAAESGHKLLLFSQFTSMLDIIGRRLTEEGILFHRLDGSVSKEERMRLVDSFANDDVPVFCISLKAGGTGLNLTAADIVIHYDPWWNQAAQNQATDRAHRIGQTQTVNVYELIARGTIEEQIQKLKENKSKLADDVLSGESISSIMFDKEDLMALLG